jgi:hypothetical protein
MSLAIERYGGFALPAVYEIRGERRLVVHPTLEAFQRPPAPVPARMLAFPATRRGWQPEDAVSAYRASLADELAGPSIDLLA